MLEPKGAEAAERLNYLGHLSAGVGHHVINAFSAIVSSAELLRLKPITSDPAETSVLAEMIVRTSRDAATVARRLIDYTRPVTTIDIPINAGVSSKIALDEVAKRVVAQRQSDQLSHLTWTSDLVALPPIRGHAAQLAAMLGLLIDNALEALPDRKGTLEISTSTDSRGWAVLQLRDSGQGMESETIARAVEPFFSTKPGHLGVGLSIANGIWRRHHGTLSLTSQLGQGTQVRLCVEPYHD